MARNDPPRITTIDARTGQTIDDEPINTIEDDIAKQLDDIIAEFGQSETDVTWQVVVTRAAGPYMKGGGKEPYLFSCDPSEIGGIRDKLRDEYGEGTYRIRVRRNGRNHRQFDYTIEAPIKAKAEQSHTVERALLERMDRMEARSNDILQQLITAKTSGAIAQLPMDPIAMFEKFAVIFASMNGARAQATGPDPMDLMTRTFDIATKLADLRGGDNGGSDTNVFDIIKEAVKNPNLVNAIANNTMAQNTPRLPMRRQFQPNPMNAGPIPQQPLAQSIDGAPPQAIQSVQNNFSDLQIAIPYLNTRAAKGAPVEFYCDWVFDNVETPMIEAMISDPHILDALAQSFPGMVPYRPWYERLLAEMRAAAQDNLDADAPQDAENTSHQGFAERASGATAAPPEPARHAANANPQRRPGVLDTLTRRSGDISNVADNGE